MLLFEKSKVAMDTKPLTKLVLLIVVLLTAAVGFCQSDDPPPGGAGPTFSVTIEQAHHWIKLKFDVIGGL